MRLATLLLLTGSVLIAARASAIDLESIPREIDKLPKLESEQPLYCLLVFGPEAKTRVWLVRDGDVLYADRNGNGDLTEADERIEADAKPGETDDDSSRSFLVGEVRDGEFVHKALRVSWFNVDHLVGKHSDVTARLKQDPQFRALSISCDVAMPAFQGRGIGGRVMQHVSIGDVNGLLDFATQAAEAPILHFRGPWQLTLSGKSMLRIGRNYELSLEMATPGLGPGSMVSTAYDRVIPTEIRPRVEFTFPTSNGETLAQSYDFRRRCCGYNLYDEVVLPEEVAPGTATVKLSLDAWRAGRVAPSTHPVEILPALPGPKILPVSPRLASKLEHMHPDGEICNIQFSPDGRKLIAGDYPGGVIHVWELATGRQLITLGSTEGFRATYNFFHVSPDWQRIYTATHNRGEFDRVERDGKPLNRVTYSDAVDVWSAHTGEHLDRWQQNPPRGIIATKFTPDGRHLTLLEEVPGEFESRRPRALSLLDTTTGEFRQLLNGNGYVNVIRDDSLASVSLPNPTEPDLTSVVAFFTLPDWKEVSRVPLDSGQRLFDGAFARGGNLVIGEVLTYAEPGNWQDFTCELRAWDVATGQQRFSLRPRWPKARMMCYDVSPDGNTAVVCELDLKGRRSRMMLLDLESWQTVDVPFELDMYNRGMAFHPSGKWLAVSQLRLPKESSRRDPPVSSLEQPRIQLIDVASGKVLETMIAPQSFQMSIAFSPDGNTLATGGEGAVLLWDMTVPPGELAPPPEVGQTLELAGTKVDGQPLDPAAYHGKVTLVSFWATWCQPCVAELPELKSIYHNLHDRGFEVVGVSLDEADTDLASFVKNQFIPWTMLHGATPETAGMHHPLARRLGVSSVPRSFLLDGEGKIVAIDPPLHEIKSLVEAEIRQADPNQ